MVGVVITCEHCGSSSATDDKYCVACGSPLHSSPGDVPEHRHESVGTTAGRPRGLLPDPANGDGEPTSVQAGTNGFAIASLVLGVLWLGGIGSLLALVFGYVAKGQIDDSIDAEWKDEQKGRGLATAGIVLGWILLAGTVALVAIGVVAASHSDNATSSSAPTFPSPAFSQTAPTTPWYPAGYAEQDTDFAYKFSLPGVFQCQQSGLAGCWQLVVITHDECFGTLDVSMNVLNASSRAVIDSTSGSISADLSPGERAIIQVPANEQGDGEITAITCLG